MRVLAYMAVAGGGLLAIAAFAGGEVRQPPVRVVSPCSLPVGQMTLAQIEMCLPPPSQAIVPMRLRCREGGGVVVMRAGRQSCE